MKGLSSTFIAIFLAVAGFNAANAQDVQIDHILWGTPDLLAAAEEMEEMTSLKAVFGGSHPGRGTANYLLAIGDSSYLEIIGPDPDQDVEELRQFAIDIFALPEPRVFTFAIQTDDIPAVVQAARAAGLEASDPSYGDRRTPTGELLTWTASTLSDEEFGYLIPFAIQWGEDSPHPSSTSPKGLDLIRMTVSHPNAERLAEIYEAVGIPVEVKMGPEPLMVVQLMTPNGPIVLTSDGSTPD